MTIQHPSHNKMLTNWQTYSNLVIDKIQDVHVYAVEHEISRAAVTTCICMCTGYWHFYISLKLGVVHPPPTPQLKFIFRRPPLL